MTGVFGLLAATWAYLLANSDRFLELFREHLMLVFVSEAMAVAVAIPLGILATRNDRVKRVVETVGNVAQTVPTLAIIALMFPLLGLGFLPALVGLFVYALLPVLTNTIVGLENVDGGTVEAARGMGMSDWTILRKIRLPLALPVIFAGIRTSTVLNVGTAYLAFFIGGGGLGVWVIGGIQLFNTPQLIAGAVSGALLAVTLDGLLALAERRLGGEAGTGHAATS
ncbi:binding-protein-dependent transport systems inner membrane component [Halogeometricum pallidum JCM 14848]|uniref:Binding-protein-dependent transport systems inner membrane component n=1 Tax=Halogeometricum pallidum JCM 14848 TaxID=1227487 RepID=M0D703_HALPD|nr:ABC transporter permease [Halogeometricum pallidum]ELZ29929.1 binding-protein-dependent transport systems inner membrane component [Halogeometricum pallidum JCM 14848]